MKGHLIIFFLLNAFISLSQNLDVMWQQCYGTTGNEISDKIGGVAQFNNGFLIGVSIKRNEPWISNYHGSADMWIIQSDSTGNILWERCYGGSNAEGVYKIIPIDNEYAYLLSSTDSEDGDISNFDNEYLDTWVVKINKDGDKIWDKCYGGTNVEETKDALLTEDGGLIIMSRISLDGGDISEFYGGTDIWICRIDSVGNIIWEKTLGNQGYEIAITMDYTSDSTFMVLGNVHETGGMVDCNCNDNYEGAKDIWLVELDLNGNVIRQLCYGGSDTELSRDFVKLDDGYLIASSSMSTDGDVTVHYGYSDYWIFKIDFEGNIIWEKTYGGTKPEWPVYITSTSDQGILIIGNTFSNDIDVTGNHSVYPDDDIWVLKLDSIGEIEWEQCFGGANREYFADYHNIVKINDYSFVVGAQSSGISHDVKCEIDSLFVIPKRDAWVFNILDCNYYKPETPNQPSGPDSVCANFDSISVYQINFPNLATTINWELSPIQAGIIEQQFNTAILIWNQNYEGEVYLKASSQNQCGESDWSVSLAVNVYMCLNEIENVTNERVLSAYPNPVREEIIIDIPSNLCNGLLQIIDTKGEILHEDRIFNEKSIKIEYLNNGLYIIKYTKNRNTFLQKIIVCN